MSATRRVSSIKSGTPVPRPQLTALHQSVNTYLLRHVQAALLSLGQITMAPWTNTLIVLAIAIALAFPSGLFVILKNIQAINGQGGSEKPILVYLKKNVTDHQAQSLVQQLSKQDKLAKVTYISPVEGLKKFRQQSGLNQVFDLLATNPLPGLLILTPNSRDEMPVIASIAESLKTLPEVETVNYDEAWIKQLDALMHFGKQLLYGLALFLALGVLVIIGSSIHLATASHREEIAVYQLVGASAAFIRRPFLYRGIWYGLLGAALALVCLSIFQLGISDSFQQLIGFYQPLYQLQGIGFLGGLGLIMLGGLLGWLGSWFAVWRQYQ